MQTYFNVLSQLLQFSLKPGGRYYRGRVWLHSIKTSFFLWNFATECTCIRNRCDIDISAVTCVVVVGIFII